MNLEHYVYFTGAGKHIASSVSTKRDAETFAEQLANEHSDVIEYFTEQNHSMLVTPEVLP